MKNKLLLVTFPVDLGSTTYATRLINTFDNYVDLQVYSFKPQTKEHTSSKLDYAQIFAKRLLNSHHLQQVVRKAQREGRKVLFQGVTPALFAYPAIPKNSSYIVTDWTRKLYEPILNQKFSSPLQTFIHKTVLNSQKTILCLTHAVQEQILKDYQVSASKLKKAKVPFDLDLKWFTPSPKRTDDEVRILFVGGRLSYKGGDVLVDWFRKSNYPNLKLTLVTKDKISAHPNIKVETDLNYGEQAHAEVFKNHDIFVLPTVCDAYPSVLGEAACSGLALLTTKHALGAPEVIQNGVNGYICDGREDLLNKLNQLVQDKPLIESMKLKSREIMEEVFEPELVRSDYLSIIFG